VIYIASADTRPATGDSTYAGGLDSFDLYVHITASTMRHPNTTDDRGPWDGDDDDDDDVELLDRAMVPLEASISQPGIQDTSTEMWTVAEEFLRRLRSEHVESVLKRTEVPGHDGVKVWDYLNGAGTDGEKCSRATEVLERLAGKTEDIAVAQMMAVRFIDIRVATNQPPDWTDCNLC
jgi:hypothetical protein